MWDVDHAPCSCAVQLSQLRLYPLHAARQVCPLVLVPLRKHVQGEKASYAPAESSKSPS